MSGIRRFVVALLFGVLVAPLAASPAGAVQSPHPAAVDAVPSALTPAVRDGQVFAIVQIGSRMVIGGTFTQASSAGSSEVVSRSRILAFDAATGVIDPNFAPVLNDYVETLVPGPTAGTVYAGGKFGTVNGVAKKGLVLLDVATGQAVSSFRPGYFNGLVQDLALRAGRLLVAGTFTKVGSVTRGGLASLDPTTGAVTGYLTSTVTEHHNYDGTGAFGAIGVTRFDITPDGTRMVLIGNFRKVDGQTRRQIAMLDLTGPTAVLAGDWITNRFSVPCKTTSVDSWVRDIDISPDGSYFVVVGKGAYYADTLCDTASRWETRATGTDVAPSWVAVTGGDTLLSVAVTGAAVYVGGHQRWFNNPLARDAAGPGAVPRAGIAALDPVNGVPLSWNPGRNPRGIGAAALYATPTGLWVGSDTEYIGNFRYLRPRLAFFPLTATTAPDYSLKSLPANVYVGGPTSGTLGGGSSLGPDDLARRWYTGSTVGAVNTRPSGGIAWSQVRGAFMLGSTLFYGYSDGMFYRRTFDGVSFGPATAIDPYNDPVWAGEPTGKAGGQTYRGVRPGFYGELSRVTGMFATGGRLYYGLSGDTNLYSRAFSADSGVVHPTRVTTPGGSPGVLSGLFFSGNQAYFVSATDGTLRSQGLVNGALSGPVKVRSGPGVDGNDWRGRAVFIGPGAQDVPEADTIDFAGASHFVGTTRSGSVNVPNGTVSGDGMLLMVTVNSVTQLPGAPQGLDGWREVGRQAASSMLTVLWQRVAGAGEEGTTVSVGLPDYAKLDLQLLVYHGTSLDGPVTAAAGRAELVSSDTHTTPSVDVSAAGSWVVSWWADKSSTTAVWTPPGGVQTRDVVIGSGSGYVSSIVADSGGSVPTGPHGGLVATVNAPSSKAATWTIVLAGQ